MLPQSGANKPQQQITHQTIHSANSPLELMQALLTRKLEICRQSQMKAPDSHEVCHMHIGQAYRLTEVVNVNSKPKEREPL